VLAVGAVQQQFICSLMMATPLSPADKIICAQQPAKNPQSSATTVAISFLYVLSSATRMGGGLGNPLDCLPFQEDRKGKQEDRSTDTVFLKFVATSSNHWSAICSSSHARI